MIKVGQVWCWYGLDKFVLAVKEVDEKSIVFTLKNGDEVSCNAVFKEAFINEHCLIAEYKTYELAINSKEFKGELNEQ